jgi:hypothetical protein
MNVVHPPRLSIDVGIPDLNQRVAALQEAGLRLRTIAGTSLGKMDLQNEVQP